MYVWESDMILVYFLNFSVNFDWPVTRWGGHQ